MKKILIVDDDLWLSQSYASILKQHGWQVESVQKADDAIEAIDRNQPDVVLLDVMLPHTSAPALLHELQSHSDLSKLPVVLCSSLDLSEHRSDNMRVYGVKHIIQKTKATPESILQTLEEAIHGAD